MQLNKCPVCGETAITQGNRLMSMNRSFTCLHCRSSLKLHSSGTSIVFMATGLTVLLAYSYFGLNSTTGLIVIACLSAFVTTLLLIPLEVTTDDKKGL